MSDNGILNGEHGMVDKRTAHEPSIRIVQVVRYPGLTPTDAPKTVEQQVLTVDMAPSLLDLCGAPALPQVHGRSWKQLVTSGDAAWRNSSLYYYNYEKQFPYTPNVRSVRTDSWKYIHYPHGDGQPDRHMAELYNIEFDPEERHNLIGNPKYTDVVKSMQERLAKVMSEVGLTPENDKMPIDDGVKQELPDQKFGKAKNDAASLEFGVILGSQETLANSTPHEVFIGDTFMKMFYVHENNLSAWKSSHGASDSNFPVVSISRNALASGFRSLTHSGKS